MDEAGEEVSAMVLSTALEEDIGQREEIVGAERRNDETPDLGMVCFELVLRH